MNTNKKVAKRQLVPAKTRKKAVGPRPLTNIGVINTRPTTSSHYNPVAKDIAFSCIISALYGQIRAPTPKLNITAQRRTIAIDSSLIVQIDAIPATSMAIPYPY